MVDQVGDTHAGSQQSGKDRPGRRAHEGVEVAQIDADLVLQGRKGTDHPRRTQDATTTEHNPPPSGGAGHLRASLISTRSASESTRHCPRTSRSGIASRSPFSPKYTPPS